MLASKSIDLIFSCCFCLQEPAAPEPGLQAEAEQPSDQPAGPQEPIRKRAKVGQSTNGRSFARRTCPKQVPAKQQWEAIVSVYEHTLHPWLDYLEMPISGFQVQWWMGVLWFLRLTQLKKQHSLNKSDVCR